ncbi:MAG: hypothetical protein WDW38_006439 [Sanguina aurantia]
MQTDAAKAAMRRHGVVPFSDGAALAAVDVSRRSAILAETGGHASRIIPVTVPSSAPSATEASKRPWPSAAGVTGGIAAVSITSLAHVRGSRSFRQEIRRCDQHSRQRAAAPRSESAPNAPRRREKCATAAFRAAAAPRRPLPRPRPPKEGRRVAVEARPAPAKSYTVAKGDTLFSIAKKHSVEVAQLRDWNHLKDNNVKLGQSLRVGNR